MAALGKNVEASVKGEALHIVIDLSKTFGRSKSGKTVIVASTEGNQQVGETGIFLGLNAYKYPD